MLAVILLIICLIIIAVLVYDFVPDILNWVGRIKIGRITDDKLWLINVKKVVLRWLSRGVPAVPKNENQRLKIIKDIKEFKTVSPISYWQEAALLKAAVSDCGNDVNESVSNLVDRYIDIFSGNWKEKPQKSDAAILAYELMSNEFVDNGKIKPAMDYMADFLKSRYEKFGMITYNDSVDNIRFVDTIGIVCPFLIKYACEYDCPQYVKIAIEQIVSYRKFGFDNDVKLPFHCYDESTKAHLGICGWGRGCAWWAVGIADSLKELLSVDGFDKEKEILLRLNIEFFDVFDKYIDDNGSVRRMVLNTSLPDSSASAMTAYCYAYLYTLINKEKYRDNAVRILNYLKGVTRRDGVIDFSQGDTMGIGYYSSSYSVVPAAQGFALAAAEILKL